MCKPPNDRPGHTAGPAPRSRGGGWFPLLAGLAAALLAPWPGTAQAGLAATPVEPAPTLQRSPPAKPTAGGYQLRCWQHGRLLFEENNVALPTDNPRYALRLTGNDGHGRPIYVAETQNATCLVRFQPVVSNPALPH